jgi:hypothetical protein
MRPPIPAHQAPLSYGFKSIAEILSRAPPKVRNRSNYRLRYKTQTWRKLCVYAYPVLVLSFLNRLIFLFYKIMDFIMTFSYMYTVNFQQIYLHPLVILLPTAPPPVVPRSGYDFVLLGLVLHIRKHAIFVTQSLAYSLNMISSSIYFLANDIISFFFMAE